MSYAMTVQTAGRYLVTKKKVAIELWDVTPYRYITLLKILLQEYSGWVAFPDLFQLANILIAAEMNCF